MPDNLPEALIAVKTQAEAFVDEVIIPLGADDSRGAIHRVQEASRQVGLFYKTQPAAYGGQPASTLELTLLRELFASKMNSLTRYIFGPGPGILHAATGELKDAYLDPVMNGDKRGAFGFTEPDDAPRPSWGVIEDNSIVINGAKSYVTGGDTADFVTALINVEAADGTREGTAMIVIDFDAEGVRIDRRFSSLDGSQHVSVSFNNVRVPDWHVVGKIGEGMPRALETIGNVRMMVSAQATGMSMWVLDYIERHLKSPHRSGSPLGDREGVRLRFADMRIDTFMARSALYRTARLIDAGENAVNETAAIKVFSTEAVGRTVDMAVQLYGGQALVEGHPLARLYREVRALRFVEGASDLLRLNLAKGRLELGKGRL